MAPPLHLATMSGWAAKQAKKAEWAEARKLDGLDNKETTVNDTRDAAMGKGEDQLFEKKLSKEEQKAEKERKKAEAKAKRDAKKAAKGKPISKKKSRENLEKLAQQEALEAARVDESEADRLAREEHIIATFASQKEQHAHAKDISVRRGVFDARRLRESRRWVVAFRILGAFRARRARSEL